jgi:catechol 2,3-dioxygenase-like lactoylglutathione lyase family enzyme
MFHHVAVASKDVKKSHKFYTEAMGFTLKKIVKRQSPEGGWTRHIFYDTGEGQLFAIWDLRGIEGVVIEPDQWQGGMGNGLPYWINHVAFDCKDIGGLERCKQRWLDLGYNVAEVKHEFIHSIYTRDPDGTGPRTTRRGARRRKSRNSPTQARRSDVRTRGSSRPWRIPTTVSSKSSTGSVRTTAPGWTTS